MNDLDYVITKNKLEILLLKAQESLKDGTVTQSKLDAVETLQESLSLIINMRLLIDDITKKQTMVTLQNVKAYKEITQLKKKFNTFKK